MKTARSNMMNLFFAPLLLLTVGASAQSSTTATARALGADPNYEQGFRLGFGLSFGYMVNRDTDYVVGGAHYLAGPVAGGDIRLQYDLSRKTSLLLTTGYTHIFTDDNYKDLIQSDINDIGMIPIKGGFKGFFWKDQFYGIGEAGVGLTISDHRPDQKNATIIIAPGVGWASKYIDLSVRYEHFSELETGQIALRVAYGFRL